MANTKNAARCDLKTVHLVNEEGESVSIADAAICFIGEMKGFFGSCGRREIDEALLFERSKFTEIKNRYAYKVRELYLDGFVKKGMLMLKGESRKIETTLRSRLYEKFIAPTMAFKGDYIGIEIEMPILNLAKEAVDLPWHLTVPLVIRVKPQHQQVLLLSCSILFDPVSYTTYLSVYHPMFSSV